MRPSVGDQMTRSLKAESIQTNLFWLKAAAVTSLFIEIDRKARIRLARLRPNVPNWIRK